MYIEVNKTNKYRKAKCLGCGDKIEKGDVCVCVPMPTSNTYRKYCEECSIKYLKNLKEEVSLLTSEHKTLRTKHTIKK